MTSLRQLAVYLKPYRRDAILAPLLMVLEVAMDLMLPLLEQPTIYEELPNGFAKGRDTVAYVHRILERYRRYQLEGAEVPDIDADALSSSESGSTNG